MKFFSALSIENLSLLLAAVSVVTASGDGAQDAIASPDSAVVKLTGETFSKFLTENPLVLAEFFAPWCGHCKALGPNFSQAADELVGKEIKLAQIDCTEEQDLCQTQGIRGYPTLKVFRDGEDNPTDYEGPRSSEGIVSYMLKQSLPAVSVIEDTAELYKTIEAEKSAIVIETGSGANETFYKLANAHRDECSFVQTTNKDFSKKFGKDKFLIFLAGEKKPIVYNSKDTSLEALTSWVSVESTPYFGELDGTTYQKYSQADLPLAYFFYNTAEERADFEETIVKLAKESRGKINFVGLDGSKYGRHAENLNIEPEFPAFVIHDLENNKKYGISQKEKLTKKSLVEFLALYKKGKVEPITKSEDVPEEQTESVYKIVGKTHDEIVNDETKDVLVKYYAPWCGHCKRLAPILEELADLYKSEPKVRIANVDATANDVDVQISGYPTLILYPAGDKSNPIVHKGGRDLQALVDFIKESGTFKIDGNELETEGSKEKEKKSEETVEETIEEITEEADEKDEKAEKADKKAEKADKKADKKAEKAEKADKKAEKADKKAEKADKKAEKEAEKAEEADEKAEKAKKAADHDEL